MVGNLLCGNCTTIWNGECVRLQAREKKTVGRAHRIQTIFLENILIEWFMPAIQFVNEKEMRCVQASVLNNRMIEWKSPFRSA